MGGCRSCGVRRGRCVQACRSPLSRSLPSPYLVGPVSLPLRRDLILPRRPSIVFGPPRPPSFVGRRHATHTALGPRVRWPSPPSLSRVVCTPPVLSRVPDTLACPPPPPLARAVPLHRTPALFSFNVRSFTAVRCDPSVCLAACTCGVVRSIQVGTHISGALAIAICVSVCARRAGVPLVSRSARAYFE